MSAVRNPLIEVLRQPAIAHDFSIPTWNLLLRQARRERTLARLGFLLEDAGLVERCPERVIETTLAARAYIDFYQVQIRREIRHVRHALAGIDVPMILLKGAAYMLAALPLSRGRRMVDVDILVSRTGLPRIEERLAARGWQPQKLDSYDQRYYREWMHEIPPLKHPARGIEVDIHHTLLPVTARLTPDPALLWEASVPLGDPDLRVLAPTDMVLHSAAHLFYDGEIAGGLRDLVDLHQLFLHYGREPRFWDALPQRAEALELARPLYHAVRYCRRLLATPIPPAVSEYAERNWAPPLPARALIDRLVTRVLMPRLPEERDPVVSAWLLYVRSHWLRMPPWLLASHLSRKAWSRLRQR